MARRRRTYREEVEDEKVGPLEPKEVMEPETKNGIVCNSSMVRVRNDPSEAGDVITVLDKGDTVKIVGVVENRFYKIQLDRNTIGYISCKFCEEVS